MFQFSGFAHLSVYYVFNIVGCPIRISADQSVFANPRSFSQLITSFIASESQGIPHTPLFCLLYLSFQLYLFTYYNKLNMCSFYFLIIFLSQYVNELYLLLFSNVTAYSIVENNGVEPLTSCVQGRRSSQLS